MEYEASEYIKLPAKRYQATGSQTPEARYWGKFRSPTVAKQFGPVTHIDFAAPHPHHFAITSSTRVISYNGHTRNVQRTFTRFQDTAYSGVFRPDGQLLAAGGETGVVQVFDAGSRSLLRQLKAHKKPVRVVRWAPDRLHLLSASDDVTARFWDLQQGQQLARLDGHTDYIRAAAVSPNTTSTWATGGYDHTCKLWDVRGKECLLTLDHGAPIEDLLFFPSGGLVATAGGSSIAVWDIVSGGRLVHRMQNHQKTVTCMLLSPRAGPAAIAAPRLLSGGLDGHLKVYDLDSYRVTAVQKYPAPILSLGLSPDCSTLAVGAADGHLFVRKHDTARRAAAKQRKQVMRTRHRPALTPSNFRYFIRGVGTAAGDSDHVVASQRRSRLKPYDRLLRKFEYRAALDAALDTRQPAVVAALLGELAARGGLGAALGGRDAASLQGVLAYLCKYIADPRHAHMLTGVAHRVLDSYGSVVGVSSEVDKRLRQLSAGVHQELRLQDDLQRIQGALSCIVSATCAV